MMRTQAEQMFYEEATEMLLRVRRAWDRRRIEAKIIAAVEKAVEDGIMPREVPGDPAERASYYLRKLGDISEELRPLVKELEAAKGGE